MSWRKVVELFCDGCGEPLQAKFRAGAELVPEIRRNAVEAGWRRKGNRDLCGSCVIAAPFLPEERATPKPGFEFEEIMRARTDTDSWFVVSLRDGPAIGVIRKWMEPTRIPKPEGAVEWGEPRPMYAPALTRFEDGRWTLAGGPVRQPGSRVRRDVALEFTDSRSGPMGESTIKRFRFNFPGVPVGTA